MSSLLFSRIGIVASGFILALAFPVGLPGSSKVLQGPPWDLLAWVALIPFLLGINRLARSRSPIRSSFLWGWGAGLLFFLILIPWIVQTIVHYGGLSVGVGILVLLLLTGYLGVYFGLFAAAWAFVLRRTNLPWALTAPMLWVSVEWLRGHLIWGYPWVLLGTSQTAHLPIIQISDITGAYGISFLIVAVNAAAAEAIDLLIRTRREERSFCSWRSTTFSGGIALFLLFMTLAYGAWRLAPPPTEPSSIRVGVVQGNIPQDIKWDRAFVLQTLGIHERLTRKAAGEGAELVVWPETAVPFYFQNPSLQREEIREIARSGNLSLLFGSPAYRVVDGTPRSLNGAYLVSPEGEIVGRYDKVHLVPFGEYIPASRILFFVSKMTEGIGDFIPGEEYTVLETAKGRIGTVICFEVIFPELVRKFAEGGADLLVTITNDAWFGKSAAPYQHFDQVILRAVENRTSFARAANTGISGFVDPKGRVLQAGPLFEEAILVESVPLRTGTSFYTRFGDLFAWGCLLGSAGMLGMGWFRMRPSSPT